MKEFSVGMSLVDFIPVVFYLLAAILLMKDLYEKMSKTQFALLACGMCDVFLAGALKALYKLLYALGICDFPALSNLFMPLQSFGLTISAIGMLCFAFGKRKQDGGKSLAVAPPLFSGTWVFVSLMVAGIAGMVTGLCKISVKMKKTWAFVLFIISLIGSLCMGYLSSRDFDKAIFNWIAEFVNIIGQGTFFAGILILHKAGLKETELN